MQPSGDIKGQPLASWHLVAENSWAWQPKPPSLRLARPSLASGIAESPGRDVGLAESGCRLFAPLALRSIQALVEER
jgi:hypothetical protein